MKCIVDPNIFETSILPWGRWSKTGRGSISCATYGEPPPKPSLEGYCFRITWNDYICEYFEKPAKSLGRLVKSLRGDWDATNGV